ncbi:flagellar export chaperone FliS [Sinanaerobacter chloroacetimidivorans]|jgi:flagellar protein FliS|uniref:Flagellar protein FliS n=1 Tax=Sinanaerobacter chloroacetimidivorans TaxID=2818044 RepID=A0A8J7VYP6_9FIRM|nr:flagellar export chaperone FliS [Sinanaerobacter chloroacetimidivorans]MBR0597509.1 flagellar protein FliS [Sinanaerobacter chloroacetimidivorans]
MQANLYQQYKTQSLETLTKGEIVVKLFEEASKQVSTAIFFTNRGESVKAYNCIAKAQKIISTLNFSLDMKYAISLELNDMYLFLFNQLGVANANQDVALMKELLVIIDEFKVTFRQAEKLARINK